MNDQTIQAQLDAELITYYNRDEIRAFLFWILPHIQTTQTNQKTELNRIIEELKTGKPIQYIFEIAFFGHLELKVTQDTLIPRPETEELCDLIHRHYSNLPTDINSLAINGIDLGTGSGCIPILLLAKNSNWHFAGVDISSKALEVANFNANKHGVLDRFTAIEQDILETLTLTPNIQLLVSNPPYISESEREFMSGRVLEFEPQSALFTPNNDPLQFYKKIAELLASSAIQQLSIWLEINQYYSEEIKLLFSPLGNTEILNDISGNPRFLHCEISKSI
jgi:release factor glutamine methyltransferase